MVVVVVAVAVVVVLIVLRFSVDVWWFPVYGGHVKKSGRFGALVTLYGISN